MMAQGIEAMCAAEAGPVKTGTARQAVAMMLALLGLSCAWTARGAADKDDADAGAQAAVSASLSQQQLSAVGVVVAHASAATAPTRLAAVGTVMSSADLLGDWSEWLGAGAAAQAAASESARLAQLQAAGAGGAARQSEAAHAEQVRTSAQMQAVEARLRQRWGPLPGLPAAQRASLLSALRSGRALLLRADVPGRHQLGMLPERALVDVDGVQMPARVLGPLADGGEARGAGLLLALEAAPPTLGANQRLPVSLLLAPRTGWAVPAEALIFDERGAFVYKRSAQRSADARVHFTPVVVRLLAPLDQAWLVQGVDADDELVVRGAGVLWSLQGVSGGSGDDDD